jgi:hypothetical protein
VQELLAEKPRVSYGDSGFLTTRSPGVGQVFGNHQRKLRSGFFVAFLIAVTGIAGARIASSIVRMSVSGEVFQTARDEKPSPSRWSGQSMIGHKVGTMIADALEAVVSLKGFSALYSTRGDREAGDPFPKADLDEVSSALGANLAVVGRSFPDYDYFDETNSTFQVGGWTYGDVDPQFYKVIALSNGHRYKIRGHFRRSPDGSWRAELNRLLRLLTPLDGGSVPLHDQGVEWVPTPEIARETLVAWAKDFANWKEANRLNPIRRDIERITPFMNSTYELENLLLAEVKPRDGFIKVGGWSVACDDSRFRRDFRLLTGEILGIEGRFVHDVRGRFRIEITKSGTKVR